MDPLAGFPYLHLAFWASRGSGGLKVEPCFRALRGGTIGDDFLQAILEYIRIESCYTKNSFAMPPNFLGEYALGREYPLPELFIYFDAGVNIHP
jgi:hypothetical protein